MVFIEKNGKGYKRGGEDEETVTSGYTHSSVLSYQRFKAESEAQRGKPKGTLESEIRIAMLLLGQRPPRHAWLGRKRCHRGCVRAETAWVLGADFQGAGESPSFHGPGGF